MKLKYETDYTQEKSIFHLTTRITNSPFLLLFCHKMVGQGGVKMYSQIEKVKKNAVLISSPHIIISSSHIIREPVKNYLADTPSPFPLRVFGQDDFPLRGGGGFR